MSSKNSNDDLSGIFIVFGLIGAMFYVMILVIGFVVVLGVALLTLALTVVSIIAWNRPVRAFGNIVTPQEARSFIIRGLHGLWIFPVALVWLSILTGVRINWDYLWAYLAIGYILGSLGVELIPTHDDNGQPLIEILPPDYQPPALKALPPPAREERPAPEPEPFRFASWDDEEHTS